MAKAARTRTKAKTPIVRNQKPFPTSRAKPPASDVVAEAAEPPPLDTRESLIAEASAVLVRVDKQILKEKAPIVWMYPRGKLIPFRDELRAIEQRLQAVLTAEDADVHWDEAQDVLLDGLREPGGVVPSFARPGRFLVWIGYIPVYVDWSGFFTHSCDLRMADPTAKWISGSGYQSLHIEINEGETSPYQVVRNLLSRHAGGKDFNLFDVTDHGRENAAERLAEEAWLREALAKGQADSIPLPTKFVAVQQSMFA